MLARLMAEAKTKKTSASVEAFLKRQGERYADCKTIAKMMQTATGKKAAMWGHAIVGFGEYPIVYADGHTESWPEAAFSPRKDALTIYGTRAAPKHAQLLKRLGKAKMGGGCLYIKQLADVDMAVLGELISSSVAAGRKKHKR